MYDCICFFCCCFCIWNVSFLKYCIFHSMIYDWDFALQLLAVQGPFLQALNMFRGCPLSGKSNPFTSAPPVVVRGPECLACSLPLLPLSPERSHSLLTRLTWLQHWKASTRLHSLSIISFLMTPSRCTRCLRVSADQSPATGAVQGPELCGPYCTLRPYLSLVKDWTAVF